MGPHSGTRRVHLPHSEPQQWPNSRRPVCDSLIAMRPTSPHRVRVGNRGGNNGRAGAFALATRWNATGSWDMRLKQTAATSAGGDWRRLCFRGVYERVEEGQSQEVVAAVVDAARPAAEILKVVLFVNGQDLLLINERQPFEIYVRVLFHRSPELVDVGLKLTRADGVYVFWQSSGMVGGNVASPLGERTFKFQFPENCLGSGEYAVSASVHNGWKYPVELPVFPDTCPRD